MISIVSNSGEDDPRGSQHSTGAFPARKAYLNRLQAVSVVGLIKSGSGSSISSESGSVVRSPKI
jgi:hypothetical protein